jgi:hypothetical protein
VDNTVLGDPMASDASASTLQFGVLPEPFIGRPDAPIVLLNLNPGFVPGDDEDRNSDESLIEIVRNNHLHRFGAFPFYYLDPAFADSGGYRWWGWNEAGRRRRAGILWPLIEVIGQEVVANNVFCAEYFPYASTDGGIAGSIRAPSSEYTFELVRAALDREALVIILRSARQWEEAVPSLCDYRWRFSASNRRYPIISEGNCSDGFRRAVDLLREHAARHRNR